MDHNFTLNQHQIWSCLAVTLALFFSSGVRYWNTFSNIVYSVDQPVFLLPSVSFSAVVGNTWQVCSERWFRAVAASLGRDRGQTAVPAEWLQVPKWLWGERLRELPYVCVRLVMKTVSVILERIFGRLRNIEKHFSSYFGIIFVKKCTLQKVLLKKRWTFVPFLNFWA